MEVRVYNGVKLIKLRNPWGSEKYTGPWSDNSKEMTAQAMADLKHEKGDDGIFWCPWTVFQPQFSTVFVGAWSDTAKGQIYKFSWKQTGTHSIEFTNPVQQDV